MFKTFSIHANKCLKLSQKKLFVTLCFSLFLMLEGCTSPKVLQDKSFNPSVYFGRHVVEKGDTLTSIARRYGRDFRELAWQNDISPPYVISIGQKINLEKIKKGAKPATIAKNTKKANKNVTKRKSSKKSHQSQPATKNHKQFNKITWRWPHLGPIVAKFNIGNDAKSRSRVNKGIDIGGRQGDPVLAAASGEVVYAGNGLLGYGNLIIVNHNERFLSAYAHNDTISVKEGDRVEQGEKIASMGSSGVDQVKLHFEIRRNGDPVDPLDYLPAR